MATIFFKNFKNEKEVPETRIKDSPFNRKVYASFLRDNPEAFEVWQEYEVRQQFWSDDGEHWITETKSKRIMV